MFNLGAGELAVILVVALLFLGPKMLPEVATGLGKIIREIRKATADIRHDIGIDEVIRKPLQELRDAATLPPEELKRRDEVKAAQRKAEEAARAEEQRRKRADEEAERKERELAAEEAKRKERELAAEEAERKERELAAEEAKRKERELAAEEAKRKERELAAEEAEHKERELAAEEAERKEREPTAIVAMGHGHPEQAGAGTAPGARTEPASPAAAPPAATGRAGAQAAPLASAERKGAATAKAKAKPAGVISPGGTMIAASPPPAEELETLTPLPDLSPPPVIGPPGILPPPLPRLPRPGATLAEATVVDLHAQLKAVVDSQESAAGRPGPIASRTAPTKPPARQEDKSDEKKPEQENRGKKG